MEQFTKQLRRGIMAKPRRRQTKGARAQADLLAEVRRQVIAD